ncbi:hypothetical protein [Nonomuraea africana]|uniref:Uncharacterized protein n=1 Tax=Nonomuraea africana TaxID=46171 RepID=A0ABR9KJN8_9ACTN|nr:hypothetical protein [Nonomuraea africana]MBE1562232.1 hypothetical protein [Nonomuraea africana]
MAATSERAQRREDLRAIWWWLPEITLVLLLIGGWVYLQDRTDPIITGVAYGSIIAAVGLSPMLRRLAVALVWCLIVRHRLRTCFNSFLPTDRHGHLPFIGWAKPIPVGERVWVWLRPGLSLEQIETQLGRIAVACWAASVTVTKARTSNSAAIYLDIKRRDVLGGLVGSPLTDDLPTTSRPYLGRSALSRFSLIWLTCRKSTTPNPLSVRPREWPTPGRQRRLRQDGYRQP